MYISFNILENFYHLLRFIIYHITTKALSQTTDTLYKIWHLKISQINKTKDYFFLSQKAYANLSFSFWHYFAPKLHYLIFLCDLYQCLENYYSGQFDVSKRQ